MTCHAVIVPFATSTFWSFTHAPETLRRVALERLIPAATASSKLFSLRAVIVVTRATLVDIGSLLTAFITFLITAAVVYFIFVLPMNKLNERRNRGAATEVVEPAIPTELELLIEIRDLLATQQGISVNRRAD